jgi:hypothetical protein
MACVFRAQRFLERAGEDGEGGGREEGSGKGAQPFPLARSSPRHSPGPGIPRGRNTHSHQTHACKIEVRCIFEQSNRRREEVGGGDRTSVEEGERLCATAPEQERKNNAIRAATAPTPEGGEEAEEAAPLLLQPWPGTRRPDACPGGSRRPPHRSPRTRRRRPPSVWTRQPWVAAPAPRHPCRSLL